MCFVCFLEIVLQYLIFKGRRDKEFNSKLDVDPNFSIFANISHNIDSANKFNQK